MAVVENLCLAANRPRVREQFQDYALEFPQYTDALRLLASVRLLQQETAEVCSDLMPLPSRWVGGAASKPLLDPLALSLDDSVFNRLAAELTLVVPPHWPLRDDFEALRHQHIRPVALMRSYVRDRQLARNAVTCSTQLDESAVAFWLEAVLSPFLEHTAESAARAGLLDGWRQGRCPMCGGPPFMSRLVRENGARRLHCNLCKLEWAFPRMTCAFCGETRPDHLRLLYLDKDWTRRVDACDSCKRYLKCVDDRSAGRESTALAEDLVTEHLDAVAMSKGYR